MFTQTGHKCSCHIICKNQEVKMTQTINDEWKKQNVVYPYRGILFSHKMEQSTDICYHMETP
jgi:hypothetical protein